jgi:aminomethyltransferase
MALRTPLYDAHVAAGARMVEFAGWDMPLHYGSQMEEHRAVRADAGIFDVSHMTIIDFVGAGALPLLRRLFANDPDKLEKTGQAIYGVFLNEAAGIVDDLIVYRREAGYRAVVNAATREKVLAHVAAAAHGVDVTVTPRTDLAMIAVQGPQAVARFERVSGLRQASRLVPFECFETGGMLVARTGYTGEDGVEAMLPGTEAREVFDRLLADGVKPAGLAARDTLRLEAGLNLYGVDMDESNDPLESNLAWTIAWHPETRDFFGRAALERLRERGSARKLTGLVLEGKGVMRHGQRVETASGDGEITSGLFSPTLGYSIALARLPRAAKGECSVEIRGRRHAARIVRPPFVRNGRKVHD